MAKKISCVEGQFFIADRQVRNLFSKFPSVDTSLRDKLWPRRLSDVDQKALRKLVEFNLYKSTVELALEPNTSQSTLLPLEKDSKRKSANVLCSSYF